MNPLKRLAQNIIRAFQYFDIGIVHYSSLEKLRRNSSSAHTLSLLKALNGANAQKLLEYSSSSKSQLGQDLFVLTRLNFLKHGYFVEFGATNGYDLSNTYLMEKNFGWSGILAEPAKIWHKDLYNYRSCNIETDCVWAVSDSTLIFNEVAVHELSTIKNYSDADMHADDRNEGKTYNVKTISLNDLLLKYNAPTHIDYLSIDTEGSEYEILRSLDFSKYTFQVITCEHNYTTMREKIHTLLIQQDYQRVFENLSLFDDWFVKRTP